MDKKIKEYILIETRDVINFKKYDELYSVFEKIVEYDVAAFAIEGISERLVSALQNIALNKIDRTRSIASTSKIKSRLTAALVINSFESRPADLVTTVTDHPERTGRYHPYVSESLLRDIRSNHTVLGCLPLLFPQCCR